jgi:YHS domain-containing protein
MNKLSSVLFLAAFVLCVASSPTSAQEDTTCPVSGKPVDASSPTSKLRGRTVAFCCKNCKAKFDADPAKYVAKLRESSGRGGRGSDDRGSDDRGSDDRGGERGKTRADGRGASEKKKRPDYGYSGKNQIKDPAGHAKAQAKPIFSGPQKGEKLRPFKATGLRGKDKGKEFDPVARAGDDMQLLLFTKGSSGGRIVPLLSHQLGAIMKGSGKTWRASVVHLSDDPNEISKYLAKFQGRVGAFFNMGIAKDGSAGPGSYGLDRTVTHTFLFAKNGKVVHNLVFTQQVFFSEPHLLGAIADVMGVDHKTLGKWLDANMSRTAGRGGARRTFTPEQKAFRKQLGERLQKGEITREEAGRLYRAKFPNDPGIKRRKDGKKTP